MKETIVIVGISFSFIYLIYGCAKNLTIEYELKTGLSKGQMYELRSPVFLTEQNSLHPPVEESELKAIMKGHIPEHLQGYAKRIIAPGTKLQYLGSYGLPDWNTGQKVEHRAKLIIPDKFWSPTVTIGGLLFPDQYVPDHIKSIKYIENIKGSEQRH